jgi:hypothetical protein
MTWKEIEKIENVEIMEYIIEALRKLYKILNVDYYELEEKFEVNKNQEADENRDRKILFSIYKKIENVRG